MDEKNSYFSLALHAGNMGAVSTNTGSVPYIALEGSYSWNSLHGYTINLQHPSLSKNGWGGRLSVGIDRPYTDKFSLNAEVGGGFYGTTKMGTPGSGVNTTINLTGYDVLAGGTYHTRYIDLFGDFGFMVQTMLTSMYRDSSRRFLGDVFVGTSTGRSSQTQVLPELKVGAAYNLRNNLSLTLSYMYAFGSKVSGDIYSVAVDAPPTRILTGGEMNQRNPSLSTILFGVRYHFA
jgi:hypothetical protein